MNDYLLKTKNGKIVAKLNVVLTQELISNIKGSWKPLKDANGRDINKVAFVIEEDDKAMKLSEHFSLYLDKGMYLSQI